MEQSKDNVNSKKQPEGSADPREKLLEKKGWGWRKKLLITLLVVLVIFFLGAGYWFYQDNKWERRIQTQLAEYRAAGQPVDLEDFDPPPTPDADNAALAYLDAVKALKLTTKQEDLISSCESKQIAASPAVIRQIIAANAKTLQLVRNARSMKGADWSYRMRSPVHKQALPSFFEVRQLAKYLCGLAIHYHQVGNDTAAIEAILDTLKLAQTTRKMPSLLSRLVAMAIESLAYGTIEEISHDLKILTGPSTKNSSQLALKRKTVESLIRELLNERDLRAQTTWMYYTERAYSLDYCLSLIKNQISLSAFMEGWREELPIPAKLERITVKLLKPQLKRETVGILQDYTALAEAGGQPTFPIAKTSLPPEEADEESLLDLLSLSFRKRLYPTLKKVLILHFRSLANRRMAAVALAIRLYEIDNSQRPTKLAELTGKYLPSIPIDPFSPDGLPVRYKPDLPEPLLYCVNVEGVDHKGKFADSPETQPDWQQYGIPFYLNGDNTPVAPGAE